MSKSDLLHKHGTTQNDSVTSRAVRSRVRSIPRRRGMLVIIDPSIPNSQHLVTGVLEGTTVLQLDPEVDGIVQISEYLDRHRGFTSLHLICHGAPGSLYLGSTQLALDNLNTYQTLLRQWQNAFLKFDLLLYGCQVAKGGQGRAFVQALGEIIGATIAASADLTGNAALGGTWGLEYTTGAIGATLAFKPEVMASYSSVLATFTANNVNELIARIKDANATPEADTINLAANTTFDLTQAEGSTTGFYGATGLPVIVDDLTINGNGATIQRVSNDNNFRIFLIAGPGTVGFENGKGKLTLNDITIKGGRVGAGPNASDDGGGIFNSGGELTIRNSTITENYAEDDGAGIMNTGTVQGLAKATIENSTISKNIAKGDDLDDGGAGIDNDGNKDSNAAGAQMTIIDSTITENQSQNGSGGGIRNVNGGILKIQNSQITNNTSQFGSGIANGAAPGVSGTSLTLNNTTVGNNSGSTFEVQDAFDQNPTTGSTTVINEGGNTIGSTNAPELLTNPPKIRVSIDPNGPTIVDNPPNAIAIDNGIQGATPIFTTFKIENLGQDPLTLGLPTLVGTSPDAFILDTQGFIATLNPNTPSTTFKVALKTENVGQFAATVNFAADDAQITSPFNFDITGNITLPPPVIRVSLDPNGTPVLDDAPVPIAFGNILFGTAQTFTTFKIENIGVSELEIGNLSLKEGASSPFELDITGFNGNIPQNQSTTFKVALKTDKVGQFNEEITFTTNDPKISEPFNIKLAGAVDPTMLVELVDDRDRVIRTIADGTAVPIVIGDLLVGNTAKPAKFRITNQGTEKIDLGIPAIAGG
ncbi:MAG: DUF4347 domain-containing protein, partial [Spirulina sp.]